LHHDRRLSKTRFTPFVILTSLLSGSCRIFFIGYSPPSSHLGPYNGSGAPTIRGRVEDSLTWLVVWRLIPGREAHAYNGRGCTPASRVGQGLGDVEPRTDVAQLGCGLSVRGERSEG
jgi:hypothetical protein